MAKVEKTDTCWLWRGAIGKAEGYGQFWLNDVMMPAHRAAWLIFRSEIPEGLELDHLCRVRHCVNPDHLEPVTKRENILRGEGAPARHARQTHCANGHELAGNNLKAEGPVARRCRTCACARNREYRARKKAAA